VNRCLRLFITMLLMMLPVLAFADVNVEACFNYKRANDLPRAIESGKKGIKSSSGDTNAYYCLGDAYYQSGELKLALPVMRQAEQLARGKSDLMCTYNILGLILVHMGEEEQALQEYNRALSLAQELSEKAYESSVFNNIAGIFKDRGQLDKALEYYQKSEALTSGENEKSSVYNNIAMVYSAKGESEKAVDYLKRAITIDEQNGNYHVQAQKLLNLGSVQTDMRQFSEANNSLFSGLEKIRKVKDSYWEGVAHVYISSLYESMGNIPLARKWQKAAVEIYTRIGAISKAESAKSQLAELLKPRPYAGIEIGAKGVKSMVLVMAPQIDDGYDVNETFRRSINTTIFAGVKTTGAFESQAIEETAKAVKELYDLISTKHKVEKKNIYLVGSSAVAKATNRELLTLKVKELTGQDLVFITKDDEVLFNVVGSIPANKIAKALSIDIGSGNTKIGYWDRANGRDNIIAVEIPLGTVSLSDAVSRAGDDPKAISNAADKVIKDEMSPKLRQEIQKRPGYRNRRPVYLVGGIVWAVATLTKPGNRSDFTKLTPADVDKFISGIKKDPDAFLNPSLAHIKDPEARKWAEGQVNSVKDVFTPENMLSGAKLLKATFVDMKIKEAYFARWGSWLAGKIYLQAYDAEEQAAKYP
jgi:tetratricopeptide (TPR) repeat protein